jgi:hypothetical protein
MHGMNVAPDFGADGEVFDFLVNKLGAANVTYMQGALAAADGSSADGFSAVIISSTLDSGTVRNKYEDLALPILNWEQALTDDSDPGDFQLSDTGATPGDLTALDIVDSDHFITSGLAGVVEVVNTPQIFSVGQGAVGPGVQILANVAGTPNDHAIMVAEAGADLLGDGSDGRPSAAAARRAFVFLQDFTFSEVNDDGLLLFNRSVDWILGNDLGEFTPGDFNDDGAIDLADFGVLANNFGTGSTFEQGDNNRDGRVDLRDFVQFVDLYNLAQGGAAAVPEPSGVVLMSLAMGVVPLLARRRVPRD